MLQDVVSLVPVTSVFPRPKAWCYRQCRLKKIRAVKVGREWWMRPADVDALVSGHAPDEPTVADAIADLRARGVVQ